MARHATAIVISLFLASQARVAAAAKLEVGPGKPYGTPSAAIAAAKAGDVIEIASGTYTDDAAEIAVPLQIVGVGPSRPHLEATTNIGNGKGIFVITENTGKVEIEGLEFSGARVSDNNGAGIRAQGAELVVRDCFFHDNQNGILSGGTPGAKVLIEHSEFANNGNAGSGQEHNVYINTTAELTFRFNYSHGARSGHNLKSRAEVNYVLYNRLMDEGQGSASYTIDLPQGGRSYLIGNLIQMGPLGENTGTVVSYNRESPTNPELALYVVNNTFVNDLADKSPAFLRVVATTVLIKNNIFAGPGTVLEVEGGNPAIDQSDNLVSDTPGLVDHAGYDYRLTAGSAAIDKGVAPGAAGGFDLTPLFHYVHPLGKQARPIVGAIDIGAYEYGAPPALDAGGPVRDGGSEPDGASPTDGGPLPDGGQPPTDGGGPAGDGGQPAGDGAATELDGGCCSLGGPPPTGLWLGLLLVWWLRHSRAKDRSQAEASACRTCAATRA